MRASIYSQTSFTSLSECIRKLLRHPSLVQRGLLLFGASYALVSSLPVSAVELPIVCVAGACGRAPTSPQTWVTNGVATGTQSGNTLTINQSTEQVTLNWQSFNISADGKVIFSQPSTTSVALNRIFQASPSKIFGSISTQLNSDPSKIGGQVYLVNPNGFVFGPNARVNASGILVSTLGITDDVFKNGLLSAINTSKPSLGGDGSTHTYVQDLDGNQVLDANNQPIEVALVVQGGAQLTTTGAGSRIMLASQKIENAGMLNAPEGQIVLAAGDKVYLSQSTDPSLRGLLVEVSAGGTAWNQLTGKLNAPSGNITMVGQAVNQDGRITASTSVSENGSVRLLARYVGDTPSTLTDENNIRSWKPDQTGSLTLGSQSSIDVSADLSDTATAVAEQVLLKPTVEIQGEQVVMKGGASIVAHGGVLNMTATSDPASTTGTGSDARLRIDSGAVIDLSGSSATRSVADNIVTAELRGTELADSPDQRNGALRGQTVTVDARVGTTVANVSGEIASLGETVAQRLSVGGTATFTSTGDVVVAQDAKIDISGGQTTFTGAIVNTSQLITADGKLVDIGNAKEDVTYIGVVNPTVSVKHNRWGVVEKVLQQTGSHYEEGYVQGSSAGQVQFVAPTIVMSGTLLGHAVNGSYQRDQATAVSGGKLVIGLTTPIPNTTDYRAPSITLTSSAPAITVADDATVPTTGQLTLSTDYLNNGGFTRTEFYSNGTFTLDDDTPLSLQAGSSFKVFAYNTANINSSITAPAGAIDVAASTVNVASNLKFNVSGTWINDTEVANNTRPTTGLYQNAGRISFATAQPLSTSTATALNIGDNVQLIANGGAWLKNTGAIIGGKGGEIDLLAKDLNTSFSLGNNVSLQAYGVNAATGGTFKLSAGRLKISSGATWAANQTYDPTFSSTGYFNLGSSLFTDHGFASFALSATGGTSVADGDALQVAAGTQINAVVSTMQLDSSPTAHGDNQGVSSFSSITTLPDYQRANPVTINLSVIPYSIYSNTSTVGTLDIQAGAVIAGDPGSHINLTSEGGSIAVNGSLLARGGGIDVELLKPRVAELTPYDPDLGIDIGSSARLDTSGTFVAKPNDLGLLKGTLYNGGAVTLSAARGTVLAEHGSGIDVSGTSAALDFSVPGNGSYLRQQVGSNAGTMTISASDAIGLFGQLNAKAGLGDSGKAVGGTFSLSLNNNVTGSYPVGIGETPIASRTIELTNEVLPTVNGAMEAGVARLSVSQIESAGFDDVRFAAEDRTSHDAKILLDAGVNLSLARRLELSAPVLAINTSSGQSPVTLTAPYVLIGDQDSTSVAGTAFAGNGVLQINAADTIDIIGDSAWSNIGTAHLNSNSDIRLRGLVKNSGLTGSLTTQGDLALTARRVYAPTATQFVLTAQNSTVDIEQAAGASLGTPLSAASALTINADTIRQNGTLLAPFGTVVLNANSLTLGDHSITSVTGDGSIIPYGFTDETGQHWFYRVNGNTPVTSVPSRAVTLNGADVSIAQGATIDVSGGGDLYAYGWVKGTGGTSDMLSTGVSSNLFAIIPSLGNQYAPFDNLESSGSTLQSGDSIYLSGGGGLAAGYYTLLPARYALLSGTYLVTAVSGYSNLLPGKTASLADGTPVVAGYRSFSNTGLGGSTYNGFAVYPGSWGRQLAEYKDSYASNYFSNAAVTTADAGRLSLITSNTLSALGTVNSRAANGGEAATIDVSANNLQIVGSLGSGSTGIVQLQDDVLNNWNAGRLLLGGLHSPDGSAITVTAGTVTVAGDAHLSGEEVVLTARDQVSIQSGGSINSTSASNTHPLTLPGAATVSIQGSGAATAALVAVSDIDNIVLDTSNSPSGSAQGLVNIANGAQLQTRGELLVNAPGGTILDGVLGGTGASWSLGSSHIVFGDVESNGQLTITSGLLSAMQSASAINLNSTNNIDVTHYSGDTQHLGISMGTQAVSLSNITFAAKQLNNLSGGDNFTLYAKTINLQGLDKAAPDTLTAIAGAGALTANAQQIIVSGNNSLAVDGFAQTTLSAVQQLTVADSATLIVGGNLNITTNRVTAAAASDGTLRATGDVQLSLPSIASDLPFLELGGKLSIKGININDDAHIVMPSGIVSLTAAQQLTLGANAIIDAAGAAVYAAGQRADSSGGSITLSAGTSLTAAQGSRLAVAGSGDADAGSIDVSAGGIAAVHSTLDGRASSAALGGAFKLNAGSIDDFKALNAALQTTGFSAEQSIHVAHGDLMLDGGTTTTANDVQLVTDSGSITVAGNIVAASTADRGSIRLYGADGVVLARTGALHADGDATTQNGGIIEIGIGTDTVNHPNARIDLQTGAVVTTNGMNSGRMSLRAPTLDNTAEDNTGSVFGNDIAIRAMNADLSHVGQVMLEAVLPSYSSFATFASNANADANTYIAAASNNVQSRLNTIGNPPIVLSPGLEVKGSGDLNLTALDLRNWRFNSAPATVTVRATGSLNINGTISDGFTTSGTSTKQYLTATDDQSATLRLVAGSNLTSVDPLAVNRGAASDLKLASGVVVRTGTGDLNLVAAHDVIFAGQGASIAGIPQYSRAYTGGNNAVDQTLPTSTGATTSWLNNGGQLSIDAGNDVKGFALIDSVTAWQPRTGSTTALTSWGVDLRQFLWNTGTLGGGDLSVKAGRDINQLSAAAVETAFETADKTAMTYYGGGSLQIQAGNDINSGMLYVGHTTGNIKAGGAINTGTAWTNNGQPTGLFIAMGNSIVDIDARKGVQLAGVTNPTAALQMPGPGASVLPISGKQSGFFTYGENSSLSITSLTGDISYANSTRAFFGNNASAAKSLPANLFVASFIGDITGTWDSLFPSDFGQLELFAGRDIATFSIGMSDLEASAIYTPLNPFVKSASAGTPAAQLSGNNAARHKNDQSSVLITAGRNIQASSFSPLPKQTTINVGWDFLDATLVTQNLRPSDVTSVTVGRDLIVNNITLGGPGKLDIVAGRNIDLGAQSGVTTIGNLNNANIPKSEDSEGADVTMLAGMSASWDVPAFIDYIVNDSKTLEMLKPLITPKAIGAPKLIELVQKASGQTGVTLDQVTALFNVLSEEQQKELVLQTVAAFNSLSETQQRDIVLKALFAELVAASTEHNDDKLGYSRGYDAIDALLPGNRTASNPYSGNINMTYSQIYTEAGGNINLFVPGGGLNVGVASKPLEVTSGDKSPSQLGIVAAKSGDINIFTNNDVSVNSSRIFTLGGGGITIWSTLGNIDAGKGAKTSLSVPPPTINFDSAGNTFIDLSSAVTGSGIRTIKSDSSVKPGDVSLIAPAGFVNAGDAGIGSSGNINIAALQVIGAENINFGGSATGVPAAASGISAPLMAAAAAGAATDTATNNQFGEREKDKNKEQAPVAQAAMSWLEVFVTSLGEENCKQDDIECLKRQK